MNYLKLVSWVVVVEEPGIMVNWQDEDIAAMWRRALNVKKIIEDERAQGREIPPFQPEVFDSYDCPKNWAEI